ncbi:UNVERIFIED_CONTAM: hypothetical protein FKN15_053055 [Acipenser sinensis]
MDTLYSVRDVEKLGLAHFLLVEASIAALVHSPNLALLSKDAACPNEQCRMSEVILKRAYSASAFGAWLGNYNHILVGYQSHLLQSLTENHRPSPQQLDELHLVNKNLLHVSKLNGQTDLQAATVNPDPSLKEFEGATLRYASLKLRNVSQSDEEDSCSINSDPEAKCFAVRSLGWVEMAEQDLAPGKSSVAVNNCIRQLSYCKNDIRDTVGIWGEVKNSINLNMDSRN